VKDTSIKMAERKKDWALTHNALHQLLLWLDEGADSSGEKYLEMRRRLVAYFDRKNCLSPDELADETLNRVARRLEEEGAITGLAPAHYCYTTAKFVFLEYLRRIERHQVNLEDVPLSSPAASVLVASPAADDATAPEAQRQDCFAQCLQNLEPDNRELIIQYYHGQQRTKIENRRAMAARLGITMNALSIRACRLRDRLEACVKGCMKREE
jgi:DNA-directed RNA polymerase specialized sigma24 family protein